MKKSLLIFGQKPNDFMAGAEDSNLRMAESKSD